MKLIQLTSQAKTPKSTDRVFNPSLKRAALIIALLSSGIGVQAKTVTIFEQIDPLLEQQRLVDKYSDDQARLGSAIQNTKDLIRKSQGKNYLPELYLRLAELYIEKSRAAYMEVRVKNGPESSEISALESRNLKLQAIEVYQRILNVYPKFLERDKVYFYLAHEFKELGRTDEMLDAYKQLIKQYPQSLFTPEALLLTGDYYFSISDTQNSRSYYQRVLAYEGHSAAVVARYKLAWVNINLKKFDKAVELLIESITDANSQQDVNVDTYDGLDIRLESLVDLAFIYPDHFKKEGPTHAVDLFRDLSWSRTAYLSVLEKVGSRLRVRQYWPRALEVYRELIKLENDPVALIDHSHHLFESYQHVKDNNLQAMPGTATDIEMLVRALRLQAASIYIDEKVKTESNESIEAYTRDIATNIHQRAKASQKVEDFALATKGYEAYLAWFDDGQYSPQIQLNLADALYNSQDYFASAIAYEKASENPNLKADDLATLLYSSVHSYQLALKSSEAMNHLETLQARSGLIATGERHLASFPKSKYSSEIEFNVAWVKYDEGNFPDAIQGFSTFLQRHPSGEMASAAIELVIDSYQVLEDWSGLHQFTQMALAIPKFDKQEKVELARLSKAAQEKIVSSLTIAALDDWDTGAKTILDYADEQPSHTLGVQALGSLMALSQEKKDLRTLNQATASAITKAPQTETTQSGLKMLIAASLQSGSYRLLQQSLDNYTQLYPKDPDSKEFLLQSAQLQHQLGEDKSAVESYQMYINRYSPSGSELADVSIGSAESYINLGDSKSALAVLIEARKNIPASQRRSVDALSGLLLLKSGEMKTAQVVAKPLYSGKATGDINTDIRSAQLIFLATDPSLNAYQKLTLKKGIDNAIVQAKTGALTELSNSYQKVLNYNVPKWSAAALYQLAWINQNYAQFLLDAPIPSELSDAEQQQYSDLISQQATPYQQEATNYATAAQDLVRRLEITDASLQQYSGQPLVMALDIPVNSYTKNKAMKVEKSLASDELYTLHQQLMINEKNPAVLMNLAQHYFELGDKDQALLLASAQVDELDDVSRSELLNLSGVIHFYLGNTDSANAAFSAAVSRSAGNLNAVANLASLSAQRGAQEQAFKLFAQLPLDWQVSEYESQRISSVEKYLRDFRKSVQ